MLYQTLKENNYLSSPYVTWLKVECNWTRPTSDIYIRCNEVHVWRIELDLPISQINSLEQTLCFDELSRANRYYSYVDRQRYRVCRGSLIKFLSQYIGSEPSGIQFAYSSSGIPSLSSELNIGPLCFNLSHSNQYALCAVTLNRSIGIDIEYMRPASDILSIAKHYFAPDEYSTMLSLSPDKRKQAFYTLWTLKEAYLKATGEGLAGLGNIQKKLYPSDSILSATGNKNIKKEDCWIIRRFTPAPEYTAGLAVKGKDDLKFKFFNLEG
ncbi:MAG: 4'-phosphopantetheinyl transferase superfamily protein [Deltaproteobacteria bacterium]|nr:4'-phosphopantetheinyl transferase superfamily protein [Deltaproteobacteria bacterium]